MRGHGLGAPLGHAQLSARGAAPAIHPIGLSARQRAIKRAFDIVVASLLLCLTSWLLLLAYVAAAVSTGSGLFRQVRIGLHGRRFTIVKLRTMRAGAGGSTVTASDDARITRIGRILRATKLDELPQLLNVLVGDMSLVGPRPDVPGFADRLVGPDRVILSVRPGITGPATLRFRWEELELARQADPDAYNRDVIFPEKVRINRQYVERYSFRGDLRCLWDTVCLALRPDGADPHAFAAGVGSSERPS